jgi:hypothetical protein
MWAQFYVANFKVTITQSQAGLPNIKKAVLLTSIKSQHTVTSRTIVARGNPPPQLTPNVIGYTVLAVFVNRVVIIIAGARLALAFSRVG